MGDIADRGRLVQQLAVGTLGHPGVQGEVDVAEDGRQEVVEVVRQAAGEHPQRAQLLGPQAVLTPLARDRAGHLRLQIVRMKR